MPPPEPPVTSLPAKPICVGLTCWLWQRKSRAVLKLAQSLGVKVELTERVRGLHREIEARVSGRNVDRFIGEFVRHC
jgi:hypothetical protein